MFGPGDKVKCINAGDNRQIRTGEVYTVEAVRDGLVKLREVEISYNAFRFEPVEAAPPVVEREPHVLWTVVFKSRNEIRSNGYATLEEAESRKIDLQEMGCIILALKKITVRI